MLRSAKSLEGLELRARDGEIGNVKDVYFDDHHWHVRYLVVATGSWLTGRMVLIASAALTARDWDKRALAVDLTKDQVRNSPSVDTARPVSRQQELDLHRYYGWPYYWGAPMFGGYVPPVNPAAAPAAAALRTGNVPHARALDETQRESGVAADMRQAAESDPNLRSAANVRGYHIEATDGSIGHVEDVLVDDDTWAVRSLLIDTRNWWPGKKVVVVPAHIQSIDWMSRTARVALTRELIRTSPEYDESRPMPADYVDRLEAHYRGQAEVTRERIATRSDPGKM